MDSVKGLLASLDVFAVDRELLADLLLFFIEICEAQILKAGRWKGRGRRGGCKKNEVSSLSLLLLFLGFHLFNLLCVCALLALFVLYVIRAHPVNKKD